MKYSALPTWLLTRLMWPFLPSHHAWKKKNRRPFTLEEWSNGQTPLCKQFDFIFWMQVVFITYLILVINCK